MNLPEKVVAVTEALARHEIPHAFGGAIALAYCVADSRGTVDMDINIFLDVDAAPTVLPALPDQVEVTSETIPTLDRDGQVRLWWEQTPVDVFFNTTDFHRDASLRTRREPFGQAELPVLACRDLAVFKAFFDRGKDWVDLEAMATAGALHQQAVAGVLAEYLGPTDPRVARVLALPTSTRT